MKIKSDLLERCGSSCELCQSPEELCAMSVEPRSEDDINDCVVVCSTCEREINGTDELDKHHWRCLNESAWSEVPAVQVVSYRLLHRLAGEGWTADLLEMLYLDEETLKWAKQGIPDPDAVVHRDSNGHILKAGDSVVLIKDLNVKGANFTAKRGTAVRRISLVKDNPEQIEGRVNDQHIVILTQYVKKS